jgi:hypothetical protein
MTELSPAAQAVLDAYEKSNDCYREEWGQLAAALRAVADQAEPHDGVSTEVWLVLNKIHAIADELEAQ